MRAAVCLLFMFAGAAVAAEVIPYGKDTWLVQTRSMSSAKAQRSAITAATKYCADMGKEFQPKSSDGERGGPPLRSKDFSLVFSCYAKDDPRLREPDMRPAPDVVIENR